MISKFKFFITNIFLFLLIIKISYSSDAESKLKGKYLHQFQEHKTSIFQIKLVSCLSLISTSIKDSEGNIYLHQAIKKTKLDREKFYDKYTIALITQCINNINEGQLEYLLIPENVDNYNIKNETLLNLLKLDYEINSLELTYEENEISKAIEEILEKNNKKNNEKKSGLFSFDIDTIIKFASFAIPFAVFLLFNSMRMFKKEHKKEMDEGTKELIDLIKERGKNSPYYKETNNQDKNKNEEGNKVEKKEENKTENSNEKPKQD